MGPIYGGQAEWDMNGASGAEGSRFTWPETPNRSVISALNSPPARLSGLRNIALEPLAQEDHCQRLHDQMAR